jgi:glucose/mannose transport system permease protein
MKAANKDIKYSILIILPSMILLALFIYGFIGNTILVSMTDWGKGSGGLKEHPVINFIGAGNYGDIFSGAFWSKFRQDLVNAIFYWLFILAGSLTFGFFIAVLLDRYPKGEGFFRTLFLYPMALSFIVTGTIWNWLLQPEGGINILPTFVGLPKINYQWLNDYSSVLTFNWKDLPLIISLCGLVLFGILSFRARKKTKSPAFFVYSSLTLVFLLYAAIIHWVAPPILGFNETHGFNIGTIGIILAAIWQYCGYTMAVYLAGLRGLSQDMYEAAKIDGASDFKYYMRIALPNLNPITLSAVIILSHISLKLFALIFAMSKPDNPITGHPSVDMFLTTFRGNNFAMGASMAVLIFIIASLFIIPYLIYSARQKKI